MPILDMDPGTSPVAPGVLRFYEQGKDPDTGFSVTSAGVLSAPGGQNVAGDMEVGGDLLVAGMAAVTGAFDVDGYASFQAGQFDGQLTLWSGETETLRLGTAGGGLAVKEGANATSGLATLVGGMVVVATDKVRADSRIHLTTQAPGGDVGAPYVSARVAGTSFTISSTSATDTSDVAWFIVQPAT